MLYRCVVSYSISTSNHNIGAKIFSLVFVVSYSISTSNHNCRNPYLVVVALYLIPFLHQTTTSTRSNRCPGMLYLIPFLHQTTTIAPLLSLKARLYLIPFLHQTTTVLKTFLFLNMLYLIPFLHQTTTLGHLLKQQYRCILFHFYIKPQQNH